MHTTTRARTHAACPMRALATSDLDGQQLGRFLADDLVHDEAIAVADVTKLRVTFRERPDEPRRSGCLTRSTY
jgi:hypothetical protein